MSSPTEKDFIDKCKHLIECRIESKSSSWKNRDYEYLSEIIEKKTKINISVSTLKRIWKEERQSIPHVSTLNALATFLDYSSWNDFKAKLKSEIKPLQEPEKTLDSTRKSFVKPATISISFIAAVLAGFVVIRNLSPQKQEIEKDKVLFKSKKTVTSDLPNTVVFNYDITKVSFDSAFIQQDWDARRRTKIDKENHYHTCTYYYPGYYTAKLVLNNQEIKTFPLFINTNGWIAVYKKQLYQEIPVYLKNINVVKDGNLYVSVDDLAQNKITNDKDFYIGFFNAQDYGVNSDNYSIEAEVKNNPADGGLTCQYATLALEAQEGIMTASFSEKGCTSNLSLRFGDVFIDGAQNDLSAFGIDLNSWRKIKYKVVNKKVEIIADGKKIHELTFNNNLGKIVTLSLHFYGCGSVRSVKLFDKNEKVVYEMKK
jgi:transcriptional regulator with XRE-family HTH domain